MMYWEICWPWRPSEVIAFLKWYNVCWCWRQDFQQIIKLFSQQIKYFTIIQLNERKAHCPQHCIQTLSRNSRQLLASWVWLAKLTIKHKRELCLSAEVVLIPWNPLWTETKCLTDVTAVVNTRLQSTCRSEPQTKSNTHDFPARFYTKPFNSINQRFDRIAIHIEFVDSAFVSINWSRWLIAFTSL